jgi:hypothetical protein
MYFNLWVQQQREVATAIPFPRDVHDIWAKISLGDPTWEKPLPAVYVRSQPREPAYGGASSGNPSGSHDGGSNSGSSTKDKANSEVRQTVHVNMHPNSYLTKFKEIKGTRSFKALIEVADHPVPPNNQGVPMCLSFHVLGMCNNRCGRAKDHNDVVTRGKRHTDPEDRKLESWCQVNIMPE